MKCSQFIIVSARIWRQGAGLCNLSQTSWPLRFHCSCFFNQQSLISSCQSIFMHSNNNADDSNIRCEWWHFVAVPVGHYSSRWCKKKNRAHFTTQLAHTAPWFVCRCVERQRGKAKECQRERLETLFFITFPLQWKRRQDGHSISPRCARKLI